MLPISRIEHQVPHKRIGSCLETLLRDHAFRGADKGLLQDKEDPVQAMLGDPKIPPLTRVGRVELEHQFITMDQAAFRSVRGKVSRDGAVLILVRRQLHLGMRNTDQAGDFSSNFFRPVLSGVTSALLEERLKTFGVLAPKLGLCAHLFGYDLGPVGHFKDFVRPNHNFVSKSRKSPGIFFTRS